jgi:hypothetical protein
LIGRERKDQYLEAFGHAVGNVLGVSFGGPAHDQAIANIDSLWASGLGGRSSLGDWSDVLSVGGHSDSRWVCRGRWVSVWLVLVLVLIVEWLFEFEKERGKEGECELLYDLQGFVQGLKKLSLLLSAGMPTHLSFNPSSSSLIAIGARFFLGVLCMSCLLRE